MPKKKDGRKKTGIGSNIKKFFKLREKRAVDYYRKKEQEELRLIKEEIIALKEEMHLTKTKVSRIPIWFYIVSIFATFIFTAYISIFTTLHFEDIQFMNITIVFLFIVLVSFFLISAMYFVSEKKILHAIPPLFFFIGVVSIMVYAFKAIDTSNLVRFSIIYTILVAAISTYILAIRR